MRLVSEDLFELIHSMNVSEKRYFKLFASVQSGEKNYLHLFNLIARQKSYDEKAIIKSLGNKKMANNFSVAKAQLYNQILKTLHLFYYQYSVGVQLKSMLFYIELLYNKGLLDQCKKILKKAKGLAQKYEKQLYILELYEWERKLVHRMLKIKDVEKYISKSLQEKQAYLKHYHNRIEYTWLCDRISFLINSNQSVRSTEEKAEYDYFAKTPLLKNEDHAFSFLAKHDYYTVKTIHAYILKDFQNLYKHAKAAIDLLYSNPDFIEEEPYRYIKSLEKIALACMLTNRQDEWDKYSDLIKKISIKAPKARAEIILLTYKLEIETCLFNMNYKKGMDIIRQMDKDFKKYTKQVEKSIYVSICFDAIQICFIMEQYNEAFLWIKKILSDTQLDDTRNDVFCYASILNLIVHFELKNDLYLNHVIKNTYRTLYKRKKIFSFEKVTLFYLKKMTSINSPNNLKEIFIEFRDALLPLLEDDYEKRAFEYFNFIPWLNSKISKRPLIELVKEANEKK